MVTLAFAGYVLPGRLVNQATLAFSPNYPPGNVAPLLKAAEGADLYRD
ncbi:MAG: hypothetical protein AABX69_05540 [Nanoarchaeota archaeon]